METLFMFFLIFVVLVQILAVLGVFISMKTHQNLVSPMWLIVISFFPLIIPPFLFIYFRNKILKKNA